MDVKETILKCIQDSEFSKTKIKIIYNSEYEKGMFSSLQTGLMKISDCVWLLYHFVDQPHLPADFYSDFIDQINNAYQWIQPQYKGIKGHPIIIHKSIFPIIFDSNSISLKEISQSQKIKKKIWNCDYPQVVEDIDTQDDYQKLT
jgi:molybdenum cofactor cytidylyltransferase